MQYYLILVTVTWSKKAKTNLSKAYSHSHYFLNKKIIKGRKKESLGQNKRTIVAIQLQKMTKYGLTMQYNI